MIRATEVLIHTPEGTLTQAYFLTTGLPSQSLLLEAGAAVVGAAVSVNGGPYRTDPDLWRLDGSTLQVPDPVARPEGLSLAAGDNVVQIRGVLATGELGPTATATLRRVAAEGMGGALPPPTALRVVRHTTAAEIVAEAPDDPNLTGIRFWVATGPGGTGSGWRLLTQNPVIPQPEQAEEVEVGSATAALGNQVGTVRLLVALDPPSGPAGEPFEAGRVRITGGADYLVRSGVVQRRSAMIARYSHDRTEGGSIEAALGPLLPSDPLWYATTALFRDANDGAQRESPFSAEVVGAPLTPGPAGAMALSEPSRDKVRAEAAAAVLGRRRDLDVKPGSFWSDAFLDPLSVEADRIRFILDFVHRARAPRALLEIDDPGLLGQSIAVSDSPYKQALRIALQLRSDADVQQVIDRAFEMLASNVGLSRSPGRRAVGPVVVFTQTLPTQAIDVGVGARITLGGQSYHAVEPGSIPPGGTGTSYDPRLGRWSVQIQVEADQPGTAGNLSAGQKGTIAGYPSSVQVENASDILGGDDPWSNLELTEQTERALASVDSGSERGLETLAVRAAGVVEVRTVAAGNPLLRRGPGTVDVWVRGSLPAQMEETAVFTTASRLGGQAALIGDPRDLRFQILDPDLGAKTPLLALVDIPDRGFGARNQTRGYAFNLAGALVTGPSTFSLDRTVNDPADIAPGDAISVDYRLRTSSRYVPRRQPVLAVTSVVGEVSGAVEAGQYELDTSADPLQIGRSVRAANAVVIRPPADGAEIVPAAELVPVQGERHLVLEGPEYLARLGADPVTVVVRSASGTAFVGPLDPRARGTQPDWDFILPADSQRDPVGIEFRQDGPIRPGDTVFFDYGHDENFTVQYTAEGIVGAVQDAVDARRHGDADPLVKIAEPVPVDIAATVVLQRDPARPVQVARVDAAARQALDRLFSGSKLQQDRWQSDVVGALEGIPGVRHVLLPLRAMGRADGSQVLGETRMLGSGDLIEVAAWRRGSVATYLTREPLQWPTSDGGGPPTLFRGVRLGSQQLALLDDPPGIDGLPLAAAAYQAHIIGRGGALIPGISDDLTVRTQLPAGAARADVVALRRQLTWNRVLLTLPIDAAASGALEVSYVVSGSPTTASDVPCGPFEHLVLGAVQIEYGQENTP